VKSALSSFDSYVKFASSCYFEYPPEFQQTRVEEDALSEILMMLTHFNARREN